MEPSESGSMLRALTPIRLSSVGLIRSQWVMQPQVLHLTNLSDLSPQEYALVAPRAPMTRTSEAL
jgi:hypothetical protein